MGYIYRIVNTINNHMYIGQTTQDDPNKRWRSHIRSVKYENGCPVLSNAIKKYGLQNFKFEIIIICFDSDINYYEKEYIKKFNTLVPNGYNIHEGGVLGGMFKGHHHTDKTKEKLSERSRTYFTEQSIRNEHGKKVSEALKKSEKWKLALEKMSQLKGKHNREYKPTEEHRKKISESIKKYYENNIENHSDEYKKKISIIMSKINGRPVEQYTIDGLCINKYNTIKEGAIHTGIHKGSIQACAGGRTKTAGGFIWKYKVNE